MIYTGVDLIEIPRIARVLERYPERFLKKVYTQGEQAYSRSKSEAKPVTLKSKSSLRLRYGLYIHSGDTKTGNVAQAYRQFVTTAK